MRRFAAALFLCALLPAAAVAADGDALDALTGRNSVSRTCPCSLGCCANP
jgi:hypothetical protein